MDPSRRFTAEKHPQSKSETPSLWAAANIPTGGNIMPNSLRTALAGAVRRPPGAWIVLAAALAFATPAHALTCGQVVTGTVTLTSDLVCQNTTGLIVQSNRVTINLNGHSIRCVSASGYEGSCQAPNVGQAIGNSGIQVAPNGWTLGGPTIENIKINGPGEIYGFEYGISVTGSFDVTINHVTITGPVDDHPPSLVNPGRSFAAGVDVTAGQCNVDQPTLHSITIESSEITNQSIGVWMSAVSCALVEKNFIHDNTGSHKSFFVYGILSTGQASPWPVSERNVFFDNRVYRNGNNVYEFNWPGSWQFMFPEYDAGISISGGTATHNLISHNDVVGNCGDGIEFNTAANTNTVTENTSLDNSTATYGGRCLKVPPATFFDAAERWAGVVNTWDPNNQCDTKSPGVPANACQ
jgi:hypothetical protein